MQKRVYICGLHEESNSFNPMAWGVEKFQVWKGNEIIDENHAPNYTTKGVLQGLKERSLQPVGGVLMFSPSGSPLAKSVVDNFIEETKRDLEKVGRVDGIICNMHGATVSETSEDVCGDIFEAIREFVGEDTPISASFDLHANITEKAVKNVDFISGYQTYPHLDMRETGYRSAIRVAERLEGRKTKTAYVALPQIAPAHAYTTGSGNLAKLMEKAKAYKDSGEIVDYNIFQVQPWLDVKELYSTVVICAESEEVAIRVATNLAKDEFALREELQGEPLISVEEVINRALKNETGKPIVLADSADSPNAGACGDSAYVLEKILPHQDKIVAAVGITDPKAVEAAFAAGVGNTTTFTVGASIAPKLSKPVMFTAKVKGLHDGEFYRYGPESRGELYSLGKTAVLQAGNVFIHLVSKGQHGDLGFYRSFGTEPMRCGLVCVKACTSFRAAYAPFAAEIHNANTLGAAGCDLKALPFEKLSKPLYPFDEITEADIKPVKICRA
ncbi:MAG: M81 family metallopeptidase [Clostridia bacterium]|nr:M81 family metallopeptidase [Clostridia bacterium]